MPNKRSAFRISTDKPRRVYQTLARDEFGEVAGAKRAAILQARTLGHQMGAWHRRKNDPAGRHDCFCVDCNRAAVVQTEPLASYGPALTVPCRLLTAR